MLLRTQMTLIERQELQVVCQPSHNSLDGTSTDSSLLRGAARATSSTRGLNRQHRIYVVLSERTIIVMYPSCQPSLLRDYGFVSCFLLLFLSYVQVSPLVLAPSCSQIWHLFDHVLAKSIISIPLIGLAVSTGLVDKPKRDQTDYSGGIVE